MNLPLIIDGVDFSSYFNAYAYNAGYIKRTGPNAGIMLSGLKREDVTAFKYKASWATNGLTDAQMAQLIQAVKKEYITVRYFDRGLNAERTAVFIPDLSNSDIIGERSGTKYWNVAVLTLEEA